MADKKAEELVSTEGGPSDPPNQLETGKSSKNEMKSAEDVAGRKGKGTMTGFLDKLGIGKHLGKKDATANLGGRGA
ncbi:hypothetical protein LTR85_008102 [Meristemomyces frigidus]|nr:hypothetical protein LTR85_008102 [Meristemomyces frigidus]